MSASGDKGLAVATVAAALVVAIVGGLIAAYATSSSTVRQLQGETERSRAEFLRTQRQSVYATFLTKEMALERVELDIFEAYKPEAPAPVSPSHARAAVLETQLLAAGDNFFIALRVAEILSSAQTKAVMLKWRDHHSAIADILQLWLVLAPRPITRAEGVHLTDLLDFTPNIDAFDKAATPDLTG